MYLKFMQCLPPLPSRANQLVNQNQERNESNVQDATRGWYIRVASINTNERNVQDAVKGWYIRVAVANNRDIIDNYRIEKYESRYPLWGVRVARSATKGLLTAGAFTLAVARILQGGCASIIVIILQDSYRFKSLNNQLEFSKHTTS